MPESQATDNSWQADVSDIKLCSRPTNLYWENFCSELTEILDSASPINSKTPESLSTKPLYRGTKEWHPIEKRVFSDGFKARGDNLSILEHARSATGSNFIPTSPSKESSKRFTGRGRDNFLYKINRPAGAVNVMSALKKPLREGLIPKPEFDFYAAEKELAIPKEIKGHDVRGAWPVKDQKLGKFINNPYYLPPVYRTEQKLWLLGKRLGQIATVVALTQEGLDLLKVYNKSEKTGDYQPFYRESSRAIGGWTGAMQLGGILSTTAATTCAPLGLYGIVGCGFFGGLVGLVVGYQGGSEFTAWLFDKFVKADVNTLSKQKTPLRLMFFSPKGADNSSKLSLNNN